MRNKLWILRPIDTSKGSPWDPWFDKAFGFIVQAPDEATARKIANDNGGNEVGPISNRVYRKGGDPWLSAELSTCIELVAGDKAGLIMSDVHWA